MMVRIAWVLLLAASVCHAQAQPGQRRPAPLKSEAMNPKHTDPAADVLRLPDAQYFALGEARRMDLADSFSAVSNDESASVPAAIAPRLALGAPQRVDLKTRTTVPVLVGSFETGLRGWRVNFKPNLFLFVKNLATGELLHSKPLVSMRRGVAPVPSGAGVAPEGAQAAVTRTSVVLVDLLDRLAGKLPSGEISATAVAYDLRSNTVRIQLEGPDRPGIAVATKRPYVRSDLDERPRIDPEIVVPERGSAQGGLRIRVARQLAAIDGVIRTELNQPFLPCHVVLVRLDKPAVVIQASPMVQQVASPDGKQIFNALFLVELGGATGHPVAPGEYRVYLDLGAEFLGPYSLTVDN